MAPPRPCLTICRAAACPPMNTERRLTAITRSNISSLMSRNGALAAVPALLIMMSRAPKADVAAATAASTSSRLVTSQAMAMATRPRSRRASAAALAFTPSISASATCAPSCARRVAQARPIPLAAPVTRAALPLNFWVIRNGAPDTHPERPDTSSIALPIENMMADLVHPL